MPFDWQNVLAMALVAAAAGYLALQAWLVLKRKKSGACGCAKCPAGKSSPAGDVVQIGTIERDKHP